MGRPSKYSQEFRERAVRLVLEQRGEYPSEFEAIRSVSVKLGIVLGAVWDGMRSKH